MAADSGICRNSAKDRLRAYAELMRLDRPVGIALLLWPTWMALWLAARGFPGWTLLAVFTAGTVLMRSAGCVINDYADRDIDGKVWRTQRRPLAEKRVKPVEALVLAIALSLLSAVLLVFLPPLSWGVAVAAVGCSALYPWTKRFLPVPQAFLGITFSLGILMAWAAVTQSLPWIAWFFWGANIAWVLAYDTAYAMADRPDDQALGIHSSALWLGHWDVIAVYMCTGIFLLGVAEVALVQGVRPVFWLGWSVAVIGLLVCNRQLHTRNPELCLKVFRQHHWAGAMLWLALLMAL